MALRYSRHRGRQLQTKFDNNDSPDSNSTPDFLRRYGHRIWDRIYYSRIRSQKISETTITENLIFDFWQQAHIERLPIWIYEAKEEYRNGNDLEIFVETKMGYLFLACQAKIISTAGNYPKITHRTAGQYQIDSLLAYAEKMGGYPNYLFYNHLPDFRMRRELQDGSQFEANDYGLTCCPAKYIKANYFQKEASLRKRRNSIPKFEQLHPGEAIPLFSLIQVLRMGSIIEPIKKGIEDKSISLKFYSRKELIDRYPYENITPLMKVSGIPNLTDLESGEPQIKRKIKKKEGYNPKYRILFALDG